MPKKVGRPLLLVQSTNTTSFDHVLGHQCLLSSYTGHLYVSDGFGLKSGVIQLLKAAGYDVSPI